MKNLFKRSARTAKSSGDYTFSADWFSHNVPLFETHLMRYANSKCRMLEIGVYEGRSTCWLLDNIAGHRHAKIVSVDPSPKDAFFTNIEKTGQSDKLQFERALSHDALATMDDNQFDFVYVDGSHKALDVLADAVLSFAKVKTGGIVAFDDYDWVSQGGVSSDGTHPKPAIDLFLKIYDRKLTLLEKGYQLWVQKTSN